MYGHQGRILTVDLGSGLAQERPLSEAFARTYLGGNGFAASLIREAVPSEADPFGPENMLVFSVGPLTHTPVWGSSRCHIAAISPLTGLFCDANFGGDFAVAQKRSGVDAICITGKAPRPMVLSVGEEGARLMEAGDLWGKTTLQTLQALQAREGRGAIGACIGPAGENGVLFANIVAGGRRLGVAGRGGLGAVMGAKNLKGLLVRGARPTSIHDRKALSRILKTRYPFLQENTRLFKTYGTPFLVDFINEKGLLGTRNARREIFEGAEALGGERLRRDYRVRDVACHGCPVSCGKEIAVRAGPLTGSVVKMPEYETLFALGTMMDTRDLDGVVEANHRCLLMGLDTISMGVTLSFVAECMEKGFVSESELGGRVLFSDGGSLGDLVERTARRQGIGDALAMGSWRLSERFGAATKHCLHAVKKLELAGHSPRGLRGMSLAYAVSTRGGSHHDGRPNYLTVQPDPGFAPQPESIARNNRFTAVGDSLVLCRFIAERGFGTPLGDLHVDLLSAVTGWDLDLEELERIGERIYTLERSINVGRGVSRKDDILPLRAMLEPIPGGPAQGRHCPKEDLDRMLDLYYDIMGWDADGIPKKERLEALGIPQGDVP